MNYLYNSPVYRRMEQQAKFHAAIKNRTPIVTSLAAKQATTNKRSLLPKYEKWRVYDEKHHPVIVKKLK